MKISKHDASARQAAEGIFSLLCDGADAGSASEVTEWLRDTKSQLILAIEHELARHQSAALAQARAEIARLRETETARFAEWDLTIDRLKKLAEQTDGWDWNDAAFDGGVTAADLLAAVETEIAELRAALTTPAAPKQEREK